jgi:hypothetical protein
MADAKRMAAPSGVDAYLVGGAAPGRRKAAWRSLDTIPDKAGDGFTIIVPDDLNLSGRAVIICARRSPAAESR